MISYSKQITLVLTSPNQGATFSMQSGSSRGTVSTFGTTIGPRGRMSFSTSTGVTSSASYERVCTAPCIVEVDAGIHRLQLELPDGRAVETGPVSLTRDATLVARYNSYAGTKDALAISGFLTLLGGLSLEWATLDSGDGFNSRAFAPGMGLLIASAVLFEVMEHLSDEVDLREIPTVGRPRARVK